MSGRDYDSMWRIHGDRLVDGTAARGGASLILSFRTGRAFEQYVLRAPAAAMVLLIDDDAHVLLMHRHRFVIDRWVWELPGGYIDDGEEPAECAARELVEETGWRARSLRSLITFQPMVATADSLNHLFVSYEPEFTGRGVDVNEAAKVAWIPLSEIPEKIADGEIVGSASVVGLQAVLLDRYAGVSG